MTHRSTLPGDPRFFAATGPHTTREVADLVGCPAPGVERVLTGLASLEQAGPGHLSFFYATKRSGLLDATRAGAVLVTREMSAFVPPDTLALVVDNPPVAWARVAALFHPAPPVRPGVHPSAVVEATALVDPGAEICARAVIGAGARIGAGCRIGPGAVIADNVAIGRDCRIDANASISHAVLGDRIHVYPGARIGQEGFGFSIGEAGFVTVPQLGIVVLEDDVEVGANATIDRGALRDTVIGRGTRLDNLVQVAHNVRIGRYCAVAAQVGLSGSSEIGDFTVIGGQAGVADHMRVGSKVRIGAQSGVMSNLDDGTTAVGSPARPPKEVFREIATLKRLAARKG